MGKFITKFETTAAYTAAESGLILPNVSLVTENNTVHYKPLTPPAPAHEYVEIGGIKWATMNVGATAVTDTGLYFQWGDTSGYTALQVGYEEGEKYFGWLDYKYGDGTSSPSGRYMAKYNTTDGKTVLESSDDAVTAAWGGNWRMPTTAEFEALGTATTNALTADYEGSGVAGLVFTSIADSSKKLFFPACGIADNGLLDSVGDYGYYWSSSLYSDKICGSQMYFDYDGVVLGSHTSRCFGCSVRGVLDD